MNTTNNTWETYFFKGTDSILDMSKEDVENLRLALVAKTLMTDANVSAEDARAIVNSIKDMDNMGFTMDEIAGGAADCISCYGIDASKKMSESSFRDMILLKATDSCRYAADCAESKISPETAVSINLPPVELLSELKRLYYMTQHIKMMPSLFSQADAEAAKDLADWLNHLEHCTIHDVYDKVIAGDIIALAKDGCSLVPAHERLAEAFNEIINVAELIDTEFFSEDDAFFGAYWNEVENPVFIDSLFKTYHAEMHEKYPDLVFDPTLPLTDGLVAACLYDIQNVALVCVSEEALTKLMKMEDLGNGPMEIRFYENGAWYC